MQASTHRWQPHGRWSPPLPLDGGGASTWVLAFSSLPHEAAAAPYRSLSAALPGATIMGCSTSGVIEGDAVDDADMVAMVVRFDRTRVRLAHEHDVTPDTSEAAGHRIGAALAAPDLRAVFTLTDGLSVMGQRYGAGLQAAVGPDVLVAGGLAGDGDRFVSTWVAAGPHLATGQVAAVGLYGDGLEVGVGTASGWRPFGPPREVTRSEGNVLHSIDGTPALALYRHYLGDHAHGLPAAALRFPLALRDADRDTPVVRAVLGVDEDAQTLIFGGDLPEGQRVALTYASYDAVVEAAAQAAERSVRGVTSSEGPLLALPVSCIARRLVLGEGAAEEIDAIAEVLPPGTVMAGFYSYGELAPLAGGPCELHNQTMTLTVLREIS